MDYVKFVLILLFAILSTYSICGHCAEGQSLEAGMVNPGYEQKPDWFKDSFLDIREDIAEAGAQEKRLILYFYQDGCPYCKKLLEDNFGQRVISNKTRQYFDLIAINMWGDREVVDFKGNETTEKQFAKGLKVMFTPTLLMFNEMGGVVLRINGYYPPHKFLTALEYVGGKRELKTDYQDYLTSLAPQPATGKLHVSEQFLQPPYRLADRVMRSAKPLLVLFEQKRCAACDELHLDILQRKESLALLEGFDIVLLDRWSKDPIQTPDAQETGIVEWAKTLDVKYAPSLIFFDRQGAEVFRTEAYLKAFHIQSVMDYVASQAYLKEPEFQRFIERRANELRARGVKVNILD
ncbi:MAG: thioredoxin fold domain-containing protein [Gammaproteobacteria bacterium]|nr:thioredoxin fold domain-containing protein [Gammaproteobacteria bacterium]